MNIILVGPGKASMSLAHVLQEARHTIIGVLGRSGADAAAAALYTGALEWDEELPAADLCFIGVRDEAIGEVAERLAPHAGAVTATAHLAGSIGLSALAPLADAGVGVGGFHPLQSMPDPETGAARLPGSWVGITASDDSTHDMLVELAVSIGTHPFELPDDARLLYHAGASAAANYVVASLALAEQLFAAAGVPWEAAHPLIEAVARNAIDLGPARALTGPIARGEVQTVRDQLEAIRLASPDLAEDFSDIGRAVARLANQSDRFDEVLG